MENLLNRCPDIFKIEYSDTFSRIMPIMLLVMLACFVISFVSKYKIARVISSSIISAYYGAFGGFVLGFLLFRNYLGIIACVVISALIIIVLNNLVKANKMLVTGLLFWWQIMYIIVMLTLRVLNIEALFIKLSFYEKIYDGYEGRIINFLAVILAVFLAILCYKKLNDKIKISRFLYLNSLPVFVITSIFIGTDHMVGIEAGPAHLLDAFYPTMGLGYLPFDFYEFIFGIILIWGISVGGYCFINGMKNIRDNDL